MTLLRREALILIGAGLAGTHKTTHLLLSGKAHHQLQDRRRSLDVCTYIYNLQGRLC